MTSPLTGKQIIETHTIQHTFCEEWKDGYLLGLYFGGVCPAPQEVGICYQDTVGPSVGPTGQPTNDPTVNPTSIPTPDPQPSNDASPSSPSFIYSSLIFLSFVLSSVFF